LKQGNCGCCEHATRRDNCVSLPHLSLGDAARLIYEIAPRNTNQEQEMIMHASNTTLVFGRPTGRA